LVNKANMETYMDYSSEGENWGEDDNYAAPDSILLSMVQSYDWGGALERIASHPDECMAVGVQGRTPLHVACDHDAPSCVIDALVKAYPEATLMVGTSNMNPLHITCSSHHASVEVIRSLLGGGHDRQTSMRDVDGDTPLHAACRCGAPFEVIKLLLTANPAVVDERDYEGLTPLLRLWVRYVVILGDDVIDNVGGPADLKGELLTAWLNTELLLRCAHLGSLADDEEDCSDGTPHSAPNGAKRPRSLAPNPAAAPSALHPRGTPGGRISRRDLPPGYRFRTLHAAAAVDCPRSVVKIASIVHPKQLLERDENGMTPLLIAAAAPIFKVRDLSDRGYLLEDQIHGDEDDLTDRDSSHEDGDDPDEEPSVIEILVRADPGAAAIPSVPGGRLPLHVAIASGKPWSQGIQTILNAHPEALGRIDPDTGLYPFLQSAVTERPDCGTILNLLRKDPTLVILTTRGCVGSPRRDEEYGTQPGRMHHGSNNFTEVLETMKRQRVS
jgi:Ankyrin repeats (3 copies)